MGKLILFIALTHLVSLQNFAQNVRVDLGQLNKNNGNFRYVAIGSSLSAGVRDGGVYAAAQQTSFPALLAQQMGVKDFKQPLLEGNGTGKKNVVLNKNGVISFTEVIGLDDKSSNTNLPKVTINVDNLAIPYLKVTGLGLSENQTGGWPSTFSKKGFKHYDRYSDKAEEKNQNYKDILNTKIVNADFYSYEAGINDFIELFENGAFQQDVSFLTFDREGYFPEDEIFNLMKTKGAKGVILNIPEVFTLPFFNLYSYKRIKTKISSNIFIERYSKGDVRLANDEDLFLPNTQSTNGLLDGNFNIGKSLENPIPDNNVIGSEEKWSVQFYNATLDKLAKKNNLPLVNLYDIYKSILEGEFITDDDIAVDPSYPGGNFFSHDGIYPTRFGNAVIANECIKVINSFYNSKIELLKTSLYL